MYAGQNMAETAALLNLANIPCPCLFTLRQPLVCAYLPFASTGCLCVLPSPFTSRPIPLAQYCNVYAATPEIRKLYTDAELQRDCCGYVARKRMCSLPHFGDDGVYRLA